MHPPPGARPAVAAGAPKHGLVLGFSVLLHVGSLALLWGQTPQRPDPETPALEMAFAAAPAPPAEPDPVPPSALDMPAAPITPEPPAAAPPALAKPDLVPPPGITRKVAPKPVHHAAPAAAPPSPPLALPEPADTAAPAPPAPHAPVSPAWQGLVGHWLQSHKTYPDAARRSAEQGRVVVRFTVQRDGTVAAVMLLHSSGSATLDDAAQALLRGAHLPPFPADMPGGEQTVSLGISYTLEP